MIYYELGERECGTMNEKHLKAGLVGFGVGAASAPMPCVTEGVDLVAISSSDVSICGQDAYPDADIYRDFRELVARERPFAS